MEWEVLEEANDLKSRINDIRSAIKSIEFILKNALNQDSSYEKLITLKFKINNGFTTTATVIPSLFESHLHDNITALENRLIELENEFKSI